MWIDPTGHFAGAHRLIALGLIIFTVVGLCLTGIICVLPPSAAPRPHIPRAPGAPYLGPPWEWRSPHLPVPAIPIPIGNTPTVDDVPTIHLDVTLKDPKGNEYPPGSKPKSVFADPKAAYEHWEEHHGLDPKDASDSLHKIKENPVNGLRPFDDVIMGAAGDVWDARTGEWLGRVF